MIAEAPGADGPRFRARGATPPTRAAERVSMHGPLDGRSSPALPLARFGAQNKPGTVASRPEATRISFLGRGPLMLLFLRAEHAARKMQGQQT